ncbi:MAG: RlpA-like double-psi beta-barrel domain-containing protein [Acetobacteraceae bacterium]|nr:RlpA-like double-psi beta-barrel domain-containing protein [Acetobacteraceae bacterium]
MRWWLLLAAALAGCSHRASQNTPAPSIHYVTGAPYELGGVWHYPQEQFRYEATGIAERLPSSRGLTADGERADTQSMTGAHPTLQLPAIVEVTNLENGRQIRIRLNDRGPANPGRLLGLTARAADRLGLPEGGAAPVRIELDSLASQALRDRLGGGPKGISAAPLASVTSEDLPPPGHARGPARVAPRGPDAGAAKPPPDTMEPLPDTVGIVPVQPYRLWVRAGQFSQLRYAEALKNKIAGVPARVEREAGARQPGFIVMAGPFASVADADAGLDQVRRSGVTDPSIVVE